MSYIYGLDLSMSDTGITIFNGEKPVFVGSIATKDTKTHGERLKEIYDFLSFLKEKYPPSVVCIERGFTRFNKSTQVVYRVVGIVNMLFYDIEQIYYSPKQVKASLVDGKASKEDLSNKINEMYPDIIFKNNDESDAFAIVLTYLKLRGDDTSGCKQLKKKQIQSNKSRNRKNNKSRKS